VSGAPGGALPKGRDIPSVTRAASDISPERHRIPTCKNWLRNAMQPGSRDLLFGKPASYFDFLDNIAPVVNRARDPNDGRLRRQPKKCVLTKPNQLRIGVVQP
jgi:hypothetical protein